MSFFPYNFLICENPATHSLLTKKATAWHVKLQKRDELKIPQNSYQYQVSHRYLISMV